MFDRRLVNWSLCVDFARTERRFGNQITLSNILDPHCSALLYKLVGPAHIARNPSADPHTLPSSIPSN